MRNQDAGIPLNEEVTVTPDTHHAIGKSQNFPEKIPLFLQKHAGDPSIKVKISFICNKFITLIIRPGLCA